MKKALPMVVLVGGLAAAAIYLLIDQDFLTDWNSKALYRPNALPIEEPVLPASQLQYLPTGSNGNRTIHYRHYTVSYSYHHQNPEWVAYELLAQRLEQPTQHDRVSFREDPNVPQAPSSSAYTKTGYDRGHLVPAHDMAFSKEAMQESFYMTNICPQVPDFNRGIWRRLERQVRAWAEKERRLYVVVGPILRERVSRVSRLNGSGPSIPRQFFKVILDYDGKNQKGIAFIFKNEENNAPLEYFVTSIDRVEAYTGLDFFPNLSAQEENRLEGQADFECWR